MCSSPPSPSPVTFPSRIEPLSNPSISTSKCSLSSCPPSTVVGASLGFVTCIQGRGARGATRRADGMPPPPQISIARRVGACTLANGFAHRLAPTLPTRPFAIPTSPLRCLAAYTRSALRAMAASVLEAAGFGIALWLRGLLPCCCLLPCSLSRAAAARATSRANFSSCTFISAFAPFLLFTLPFAPVLAATGAARLFPLLAASSARLRLPEAARAAARASSAASVSATTASCSNRKEACAASSASQSSWNGRMLW
mmetsp:Transcript_15657/g.39859  ORF Transcript_15657/g.39859 Transcript_15657/m.39859 type:complete len:256 (+) Transcript_15657:1112-1879(+)